MGAPVVAITAVDANNFPEMFAYVSLTDVEGQPLVDLQGDAFTLTENGKAVTPSAVQAVTLGVQTVFAFDVGPAFKTRDVTGNSRLDYLRLAIESFAASPEGLQPELDDISLITPEQELLIHANTRGPVTEALRRYATEYVGAADPVALLTRAIDIASDATTRPGMRRVVVYASNGLAQPDGPIDVNTLVQRAQSAGIKILTVYVGPEGTQEGPGAAALETLAEETGGLHLYLQGDESLAPLFEALAAERGQYQIGYRSRLSETGQHRLGLSVELPDRQVVRAREAVFQLRVEPPSVTLGELPDTHTPGAVDDVLSIPYTLNFSDGHVRALSSVELLVDGQVAARATEAGEAIDWPLAGIVEPATHTVQIRIVDELGLEGLSTAADLQVEPPSIAVEPTLATMAARPATPYAFWAGLLSLAALGAVGVVVWRRQLWKTPQITRLLDRFAQLRTGMPRPAAPTTEPAPHSEPGAQAEPMAASAELTQPVQPVRQASPGRLRMPALSDLNSLPRPQMPRVSVSDLSALPRRITRPLADALAAQAANFANSHAVLEIIDATRAGRARIELNGVSMRFGRDPELAEVTFDDRSVSRLHARIEAVAENVYRIYDEGSTSGTWVNFNQVTSAEGHELTTGDVINLGRVKLKFKKARQAKRVA